MTLHIASRDVGDIVNSYQQYQTVAAIKRGFWVGAHAGPSLRRHLGRLSRFWVV